MHLHIAIPAMNELGYLEKTISSLCKQTEKEFTVHICVNQPESYNENPDCKHICENNHRLLEILSTIQEPSLKIIDRSSPGRGWTGKQHGVGQARKVLMDTIAIEAEDDDLIISLDADTLLPEDYFQQLKTAFKSNRKALALSAPYYHNLTGDDLLDRSILHYEIYMRHYLLNLFRIKSPYAFTALGSALAVTVKAYKKIGGMTPKLSGEDFYFLQKIRKCGELIIDLPCPVYPAARYSDRVFFGTGPALIKGAGGNWESYPVYAEELFDRIQAAYSGFPALFTDRSIKTPLDTFLSSIFKETDIWEPLRKNNKNAMNFVKACHEKVDGLRILQYLKEQNDNNRQNDAEKLRKFILTNYSQSKIAAKIHEFDDFNTTSVVLLNEIRNFLYQTEQEMRSQLKSLH